MKSVISVVIFVALFSSFYFNLSSRCPCLDRKKTTSGARRQKVSGRKEVNVISPVQLLDKISKSNCTLINVLSEDVYKKASIPGSLNIPKEKLKEVLVDWDRDTSIVLYCFTDNNSRIAYQILKDMGFSCIAVLKGGMFEWLNSGYELVGVADLEVLRKIQEEYKRL